MIKKIYSITLLILFITTCPNTDLYSQVNHEDILSEINSILKDYPPMRGANGSKSELIINNTGEYNTLAISSYLVDDSIGAQTLEICVIKDIRNVLIDDSQSSIDDTYILVLEDGSYNRRFFVENEDLIEFTSESDDRIMLYASKSARYDNKHLEIRKLLLKLRDAEREYLKSIR